MRTGVSVPRNEKLAAVFHRLRLIEAYGTGIPRIFDTYEKYGATPGIPITNGGFLIKLPNLGAVAHTKKEKDASKSGKSEQHVLNAFAGQQFTKQEVAELLGMTASGAYKLLARMAERGLLSCRRNGRELQYSVAVGRRVGAGAGSAG
jgi:ATP-dependent DNA helicase RecG